MKMTFDEYDKETEFILKIKNPNPNFLFSKEDIERIINLYNKDNDDNFLNGLIIFLVWMTETCNKPEKKSENEEKLKYINEFLRNNLELID